jgi:small subunit ribosomal protein S17
MDDEPDNETEIPDEAAAPVEDAPEAVADAPESPDASAQDDVPEPADAPEPTGGSAPAATEPAEQLSSKERRRKARSTHTGEARPTRSPEERHAERAAERKAKALRRRARRLQERERRVAARGSAGGASQAEPLAPVHAQTEGVRKVRQGIVVSDKADKTITVRIDTARRHRRYEKIVRSSSTLHAHDENNDAHEGDTVRVIESRPLSRSKRWRLVDVLERAR